jgi:hypothetical protein
MVFTVIRVINGNTFEVSPQWDWNGRTGSVVKANGYDVPDQQGGPGYQTAKDKLEKLLLNEQVELVKPLPLPSGPLLADVIYKGLNLADYFYEYK